MDIARNYSSRTLDYHKDLGINGSVPLGNMGICKIDNDRYLVALRQFGYVIDPLSYKYLYSDYNQEKRCHVFLVDRNFTFIKRIQCDRIESYEDLRLVPYGQIIQASGTDMSYGRKQYRISCSYLSLNDTTAYVTDKKTFQITHEKNYIPIEDCKGVFISDLLNGKLRIISTADVSHKYDKDCKGLCAYSGSSPLLRYRDGYVALVHRHERRGTKQCHYFNAFAFFDKRLVQCRISDEFTVFNNVSTINFACGMILDGDKAIIPFCIHDCETHLFELPLQDFSMTARWR